MIRDVDEGVAQRRLRGFEGKGRVMIIASASAIAGSGCLERGRKREAAQRLVSLAFTQIQFGGRVKQEVAIEAARECSRSSHYNATFRDWHMPQTVSKSHSGALTDNESETDCDPPWCRREASPGLVTQQQW